MHGLIGLDWGTTRLRAYRYDDQGKVLDACSRPWGIRSLPDGGFAAALAGITAEWPALPRIACGMVGSRNGWLEVPYVDAPADIGKLCAAVQCLRLADGSDLHIVPGLRDANGPDVMRGEETQVFGALVQQPALAAHSTWILPGTHCKWAHVDEGAVTGFRTLMTGELYSLLWNHSILGTGAGTTTMATGAFERGVLAARDSGERGALSRLFTARALMLEGALAADEVSDYLSGLLIGEEFRTSLAAGRLHADGSHYLIGEPALCARYTRAASCFGLELAEAVTDAAAYGLWHIACRLGLVSRDGRSAPQDSVPC